MGAEQLLCAEVILLGFFYSSLLSITFTNTAIIIGSMVYFFLIMELFLSQPPSFPFQFSSRGRAAGEGTRSSVVLTLQLGLNLNTCVLG